MVSDEQREKDDLSKLVAGVVAEFVACHGRSQYNIGTSGKGLSACGIAAVNCARIVLGMARGGFEGIALAREIAKKTTTEEVLSICALWDSATHIDVEDIYRTPFFKRSLSLVSSDFGQPGVELFSSMLNRLKNTSQTHGSASCAIITRPPEIFACFYIPSTGTDIFVVFDSHPRPDHSDGAAFTFRTSLKYTAEYLAKLLRFDRSLIVDKSNQWEAQLLGQLSCHTFVARAFSTDTAHWMEATLKASVQILNMQAEFLNLKAQNVALSELSAVSQTRNATLAQQNEDLRRRLQQETSSRERLEKRAKESKASTPYGGSSSNYRASSSDSKDKGVVRSLLDQGTSALSAVWNYGPTGSDSMPGAFPPSPQTVSSTSSLSSPYGYNAYDHTRSRGGSSRINASSGQSSNLQATVYTPPITDAGIDRDLAFALEQQRIFDEEDRRLSEERRRLHARAPALFRCGVCLDDYTEDYVAVVDACQHRFCRECMRDFVVSKVQEHRYPVICPLCQTDTSSQKRRHSILDSSFVQQLGLSEKQFSTYIELEMASISIMLHCRSCKESFFVDKRDIDSTDIVTCPLPRCAYSWCRSCSQPVEPVNSEQHSCDGSTEFKQLMSSRGWKYCPGCQTPAEKIDGCNHLLCTAPGCNTHFCYSCSKPIVRSVDRDMIKTELQRHYRKCDLFRDIPDTSAASE